MTNRDGLIIGLALNHIAMSVSDEVLERIKPHLDTIEKTVMEELKGGEENDHRTND